MAITCFHYLFNQRGKINSGSVRVLLSGITFLLLRKIAGGAARRREYQPLKIFAAALRAAAITSIAVHVMRTYF